MREEPFMYNIMDYGALGDGAEASFYFREEEFTDPAVSC